MNRLSARLIPIGVTACAALASPCRAQADEWEFRAVPYVWASGLDGQSAALPGFPAADIDQSFGDVFDNLDFAFFAVTDARKGPLLIRTDIAYASLNPTADTPGTDYSGVDLVAKTFNVSLSAGYSLVQRGDASLDLLVGGRLWSVKNTLTLEPGTQPGVQIEGSRTFFDPIVGAALEFPITHNLQGVASGSIGGFGVGADLEFGAAAGVFWRLGSRWGVAAGYRYQSVDFDDDGFIYDMDQSGPYLGAFFEF